MQSLLPGRVSSVSPDPAAYGAVVREFWPYLGTEDIIRLAGLGSVFRLLAMVHWLGLDLAFPWVIKPMAGMRVYQAEMAWAVQAAGLAG